MAEDPPASTQAPVTTAVATGGVVATQSSIVASTNLTQAATTPLVSSQIQLQALQAALQAAQISSVCGLLNTSVTSDAQQVPIFSPGMAVPGPFNLGSMSGSLPGFTPPTFVDVNSLAGVVSRMALDHSKLLMSKRERDIDVEVSLFPNPMSKRAI